MAGVLAVFIDRANTYGVCARTSSVNSLPKRLCSSLQKEYYSIKKVLECWLAMVIPQLHQPMASAKGSGI